MELRVSDACNLRLVVAMLRWDAGTGVYACGAGAEVPYLGHPEMDRSADDDNIDAQCAAVIKYRPTHKARLHHKTHIHMSTCIPTIFACAPSARVALSPPRLFGKLVLTAK